MTGLTHEQARKYLHARADKCLGPTQQGALEAHLEGCAACRGYADEFNWLQVAITRALHSRWSSAQRTAPPPVEMAARVRHRMLFDAERTLLLTFASAVVRLGSLAVVAVIAIGMVQDGRLTTNQAPPAASAPSASGLIDGLPSFELETGSETPMSYVSYSSSGDAWLMPGFPFNRLRVSRY